MKTNRLTSALLLGLLCLAQGSAFSQPGKGNGNSSRCGNGDQGCEREQMRNSNPPQNNRDRPEAPAHGADER